MVVRFAIVVTFGWLAASVPAAVTFAVPSKAGVIQLTSPVMAIVRPVCSAVAVPAFPLVFKVCVEDQVGVPLTVAVPRASVCPLLTVAPAPNVGAAVTFAVPSNDTPQSVRAFCRAVAVAALPLMLPVRLAVIVP